MFQCPLMFHDSLIPGTDFSEHIAQFHGGGGGGHNILYKISFWNIFILDCNKGNH